MKNITPIFYDESSLKSILVWTDPTELVEGGPMSIVQLAQNAGLKKVCFVSKNFHTFSSALKLCNKYNLELCFGLELWVTEVVENTEQSTLNESKVIVWIKNSNGYKDLIKLYSAVFTNEKNKYYHYRGSWDLLNQHLTDNLILSIPFFDSFIHKNLLQYGARIVPKLPKNTVFFSEVNSGVIYAQELINSLEKFCLNDNLSPVLTKTCYYNKYEDSRAWMVYRCILNRTSFSKPEMEHCSSNNFCFEDYCRLNTSP